VTGAAAESTLTDFGGHPRRRGAVVVDDAVVDPSADAEFGGRPRRRAGATFAAGVDGGCRNPWIAASNADNSAISSRTSVSRADRFSRFFFVAFSRRDARHVSSDRAAESANSSHSTWRASAASGVIDPPGPSGESAMS
jgi:hypothetical protein